MAEEKVEQAEDKGKQEEMFKEGEQMGLGEVVEEQPAKEPTKKKAKKGVGKKRAKGGKAKKAEEKEAAAPERFKLTNRTGGPVAVNLWADQGREKKKLLILKSAIGPGRKEQEVEDWELTEDALQLVAQGTLLKTKVWGQK